MEQQKKCEVIAKKMLDYAISENWENFIEACQKLDTKSEQIKRDIYTRFEELLCGLDNDKIKTYITSLNRFNNKKILESMSEKGLEFFNAKYLIDTLI